MELLCPDSIPAFLNFFDISIAPKLLFYTYVPTVVISFLLGIFALKADKKSLASKLLFFITLFFGLWVLDILILWIAAYNNAIMLGWQITPLLEIPIFLFSIYFVSVFTTENHQDISDRLKILLLSIMGLVAIAVPTKWNISDYDLNSCEGILGPLWGIMYIFEFVAIALVAGICINNFRKLPKHHAFRKQIILIGVGMSSFLILFVGSNILGETFEVQEISFIGSLGMVVFLAFLSYLITRYRTFNIKVIATQILVAALIVLISSLLLVEDAYYSEVITGITLILVIGLGYSLSRNVKREVEQRERIQALALDLKAANDKLKELDQLKSEFLSLATHQIRSPLTSIKGYASLLLEGDYGELDAKAKEGVKIIFNSTDSLVKIVGDFLNISRIEQGRMVYNKETFDLAALAKETANEYKPNVDKAKLALKLSIPDTVLRVNADRTKTKGIIGNLIDNAIKYTKQGSIEVVVGEEGGKAKVSVKDTGIGIPPEEKGKLFNKFSRTKDAHLTNVTGTGLGLYVAKQMALAQGGDIEADSPGESRGSTFTFKLPRVN